MGSVGGSVTLPMNYLALALMTSHSGWMGGVLVEGVRVWAAVVVGSRWEWGRCGGNGWRGDYLRVAGCAGGRVTWRRARVCWGGVKRMGVWV